MAIYTVSGFYSREGLCSDMALSILSSQICMRSSFMRADMVYSDAKISY